MGPETISADPVGVLSRILPAWLTTIRARLFTAFGFAAAMTAVCSLIALYVFTAVGGTTAEIVSRSLPATVESLRLAEETSDLVAAAPPLMAADDDGRRSRVAADIARQGQNLTRRIERLRALDTGFAAIDALRAAMLQQLDALNRAVGERIAVSTQRQAMARSIREAHEKFLEAIIPAIDDANFDLMTTGRPAGNQQVLNEGLDSLRILLELQGGANLMAGLLTEASLVSDATHLKPLRERIDAAQHKIEINLKNLADPEQRRKLGTLYANLAAIAAENGIVALRTRELGRQHEAQEAFAATQSEAMKLKQAVNDLVEQQQRGARTVSERATDQVKIGRIVLIGLSSAALVAAVLIAWLYVGRNIARRLGVLSGAMRRIADGDLTATVPDVGRDEIADMARAVLVFRQAAVDVWAARERDAQRAESSEIRRQEIEAATRTFEQAISDVIRALDGAAKAMDSSAGVMAASADRNQQQAQATAAASEQATANVGNVAMAAEEMAQSVRHISARIGDSAAVARQAAGEARGVTTAVQELATSVGQIAEVSNLIRTIAAQTNLLALNATIEAARAGQAGRGFAVVAQEVKSLAAQTRKATEDITSQISGVEGTTAQAIEAMNAIVATITRLDHIANEVAVSIQQQGSVTHDIARNANGAAEGTREVSKNISQVSQAATEIGQAANIVLNAAGELAVRSQTLGREVECFLAQVRAG